MTNLFEKLNAMRKKNENEAEERPAPGVDLIEKLQSIGDKKEVNPPNPASNEPCPFCGVGKPPGEALTAHMMNCKYNPVNQGASRSSEEPTPEDPAPEPPKKKSPASGTCPTCKKEFLHLSRHKCKEILPPTQPETCDKEKAEGVEPVPPEAVEQAKAEEEAMKNGVGIGQAGVPAYDLFLDAVFERNGDCDISYFSDIIAPLAEAVAVENRVEYWSVIDYGKSPGLLAAKLENFIKAEKPTGIILADSSTPELRACKEVLKRYARNVVQGVR